MLAVEEEEEAEAEEEAEEAGGGGGGTQKRSTRLATADLERVAELQQQRQQNLQVCTYCLMSLVG